MSTAEKTTAAQRERRISSEQLERCRKQAGFDIERLRRGEEAAYRGWPERVIQLCDDVDYWRRRALVAEEALKWRTTMVAFELEEAERRLAERKEL